MVPGIAERGRSLLQRVAECCPGELDFSVCHWHKFLVQYLANCKPPIFREQLALLFFFQFLSGRNETYSLR